MRDLALDLDWSGGRQAGIEAALRHAVLNGQLAEGDRLPSSRALAAEIGCARATVVAAYDQLVGEGYLLARRGAGTLVGKVGFPAPAVLPQVANAPRLANDFLPGEPDRSSFPRSQWLASTRRVLATGSDRLFGYPDPRGARELRSALATYLGRSRATVGSPDRVVIFGGFAQALSALAQAFRALGVATAGVEEPGMPAHRQLLDDAGLAVRPIPIDGSGLNTEALARSDAQVVLTTPAHQYPLGVALAPGRRVALLEWARRVDGWIIEDDYDGEFRYDRHTLGALQGLDPDRVIYAGTASKSLAAGLRLAWLILPQALVEPVVDTKRATDGTSNLDHAVLADFIESGRLDRHLRLMRTTYRRRRDDLVAELYRSAPWMPLSGIAAGLHATARLSDDGPREEALIRQVEAGGFRLFGLTRHWSGEPTASGVVIGYSRSPAHAFPATLARFGELLSRSSG